MKHYLFLLMTLTAALFGCNRHQDSLIGTWTVDKVNVQFDERRNTPELVKQVGEMERQNTIVISPDSLLVFKSLEGETQGRVSLSKDGTLTFNGTCFGLWKEGSIVTRTDSPLGEIVVTYRKTGF